MDWFHWGRAEVSPGAPVLMAMTILLSLEEMNPFSVLFHTETGVGAVVDQRRQKSHSRFFLHLDEH